MSNKLMSSVYMYGWFMKLIGAALLIALAISLYFADLEHLIEAFVGVFIAIYAIVRLVPFIRSQDNDLIKTINIIEITLNILVAAIFIIGAFAIDGGIGSLFGYLLGAFLVARGMVHFYGISYGAEKGDHPTYFFHIATLIAGSLILYRGFTAEDLIILLIILALGASGYLSFESYGGYHRFRKHKQMETHKDKNVRDEVPKGIDAPGQYDDERDKDRDRPVA